MIKIIILLLYVTSINCEYNTKDMLMIKLSDLRTYINQICINDNHTALCLSDYNNGSLLDSNTYDIIWSMCVKKDDPQLCKLYDDYISYKIKYDEENEIVKIAIVFILPIFCLVCVIIIALVMIVIVNDKNTRHVTNVNNDNDNVVVGIVETNEMRQMYIRNEPTLGIINN